MARVRSGPLPPPCAPSPWHSAQLMRNSYSPAFAALPSLAKGLRSSAALDANPSSISATNPTPHRLNMNHLPGICRILRHRTRITALEIVGICLEPKFPTRTCPAVLTVSIRWDEKAGLRRDAVRSQVIDAL